MRKVALALAVLLFACSSSTDTNWRPPDSNDYLLRGLAYRFAYCGEPGDPPKDTIRVVTETPGSYVALIMQPVNHRNGMYYLDAYWAVVLATGDTTWMFLGQQTGSFWGADTTEVMFWGESTAFQAGSWLMPLLTWLREGDNLAGTFHSSCEPARSTVHVRMRARGTTRISPHCLSTYPRGARNTASRPRRPVPRRAAPA
jgi:hypothetical protein